MEKVLSVSSNNFWSIDLFLQKYNII